MAMVAGPVLSFKIACPHTRVGDVVGICGSSKELGEWHPEKMFMLSTTPELFPLWTSESSVPVRASTTWKIVIRSYSGATIWEDGPNRNVPGVGQLTECTVTATFGQPVLEITGSGVTCDFFNSTLIPKEPEERPAEEATEEATEEADCLAKHLIPEKEDVPEMEDLVVHRSVSQEEPEAEASTTDSHTELRSEAQAPQEASPLLFVISSPRAATDDTVPQIDCASHTLRSFKEMVSHATADKTMVASVAGFAAAGSTCGGLVGFVSGAGVGAAVGVFPAIFTFGLSIPVCASLGAATGTGIAASVGSVVGGAGGWAACKLGRKLSSELAAMQVTQKIDAEKNAEDSIRGA
eukprot:TRINITY_DN10176_c0_g1_i8.p1 TRINITY_DN10176_c0_g1~~TRINITY_DN10176_c0_g1_i8.p1  ORF type:complete len:351 (-),score=79.72 TRINITY_DN10176_c0_g1_i8:135-1187(-)